MHHPIHTCPAPLTRFAPRERPRCLLPHAADESGAGTDADVFVEIHGDTGHFGPFTLTAPKGAFERAKVDTFSLNTPALGAVQSLTLGHNDKGVGAAWCVARAMLEDMKTGEGGDGWGGACALSSCAGGHRVCGGMLAGL